MLSMLMTMCCKKKDLIGCDVSMQNGMSLVCSRQTGELTHIMAGENLSSTDLHLACNDTLLVGQVAEMTQIDPNDTMATNRLHHRKLQVIVTLSTTSYTKYVCACISTL